MFFRLHKTSRKVSRLIFNNLHKTQKVPFFGTEVELLSDEGTVEAVFCLLYLHYIEFSWYLSTPQKDFTILSGIQRPLKGQ